VVLLSTHQAKDKAGQRGSTYDYPDDRRLCTDKTLNRAGDLCVEGRDHFDQGCLRLSRLLIEVFGGRQGLVVSYCFVNLHVY
jgi:hypothetical protein